MKKIIPIIGLSASLALLPLSNSAQSQNQKKITDKTNKALVKDLETNNKKAENTAEFKSIDLSNKTHEEIINMPADSLPLETIREHMMIELNHVRDSLERNGQVVLNEKINQCVQEYAIYMEENNRFKHKDKEGNPFTRRLNKYGFNENNCAGAREVLGSNQKNIKEIMWKWLNKSEGHREALLRNGLTDIGVGYYKGYRIIDLIEKRR